MPGLYNVLALDYGLVGLDPAYHVVGLDREHLLEVVCRRVGFKRPDLHFAESLSPELRLSSQRLLSYERVGSGGSSVYLVFNQVYEFHHVDLAHRNGLVEGISCTSVVEDGLAYDGSCDLLVAVEP